MPIYSLQDLRRTAPESLRNASDSELLGEYAKSIGADVRQVADYLGIPTGEKSSALAAGISSGVDQLQGLGYSALGGVARGLGADRVADWANRRADVQQTEAYLAGKPELEQVEGQSLSSAPSFLAYQVGKQLPIMGGILAAQAIPGVGQASTALGLGRLGVAAPRVLGGAGGVEAGASFAARRAALEKGSQFGADLLGGGAAGGVLGYGSLYQESREGGDESPYSSALKAIPYGLAEAFVPTAVKNAVLRGGTGLSGGLARRMATAGALAAGGESATELLQNELEMSMRSDLTPEQIASRRLNSAVVGGLVGGAFGTLGGIRSGSTDLLSGALEERTAGLDTTYVPKVSEGAGLSTVDLINQVTGITREKAASTPEAWKAALAEPTGMYVSDPATGIERPVLAGDVNPDGTLRATAPSAAAASPTLQTAAADQQLAQAQQAQQPAPEMLQATAKAYGLAPASGANAPTRAWDIAGQRLYGEARVQQFLGELIAANQDKAPEQVALEAALVNSGVVKISTPTVKSLMTAIQKQMEKFQISDATSLEEATARLDDQIKRLAEMGKGTKDKTLDALATTYEALTGKEAPSYQLAMKSKAETAAAKTTPTEATNGLLTAQTQAAAPVAPTIVPTTAPEPQAVGQRVSTPQNTGAPAPAAAEVAQAAQTWEDMDVSGVQYKQLSEADRAQWDAAVASNTATGDLQEKLANTYRVEVEEAFAQQLLDRVIARVIKSPKKAQFFADYLAGSQRDDTLKNIAADYGVSLETVRDWNKELKTFLETKADALREAFQVVAVEMRIEPTQLQLALREMNQRNRELAAEQEQVTIEEGGTGETELDQREVSAPEGSISESSRKSASIQEQFNASETVNARYLRLTEELDAAEQSGDEARVAEINAQLAKVIEDAATQANKSAKRVRAQAGKSEETQGEKQNAVQERSTTPVSPRKGAKTGSRVGEKVSGKGKVAGARSESQAAAKEQTKEEVAAAQWGKLQATMPDAIPAWNSLSEAQKGEVLKLDDPSLLNMKNVERIVGMAQPKQSKAVPAQLRSVAADVVKILRDFIGAENAQRLSVVQKLSDIPKGVRLAVEKALGEKLTDTTQGFVFNNKAWLIADNIEVGTERAVFLHEIGVHLGLENQLDNDEFDNLVDKITEWADLQNDTIESRLAVRALERVAAANTAIEQYNSELIAYFVEEAVLAGINPTADRATTPVEQWLKKLFAAFKTALRRLNILNLNKLDAVDIVNLAYGAARLEIADSWHAYDTKTMSDVKLSKRAEQALNSLPKAVQPQVLSIYDTVRNIGKRGMIGAAFLSDLADMAKKALPSSQEFVRLQKEQDVEKVKFEERVKRVLVDFDALPSDLKGTGDKSVNRFIKDSTISGKWGYKINSDAAIKLDPELKARFEAFPDAAQKVIRSVFQHGYDSLMLMKRYVRENINTEYDELIKQAQDAKDDAEVARLQKDRDASLANYQRLLSISAKGPYAPLGRFGNYVVVGKSRAYQDAVKNNDTKLVEKLQADPRHYYVTFAETIAEGQAISRELKGKYDYVSEAFEKDAAQQQMYGGADMNRVFARLKNLVKEDMDSESSTANDRALNRMVSNLHLKMLSEYSARQAENRRMKVAGSTDDMMRSFATQGLAMANFLGSLKNTSKIYDSIRNMKREAAENTPGRDERQRYYNEFMKRHVMGYEYNPSSFIDGALAATSGWMLITSPAYLLQNLTQPFMLSVPYMAGTHGEGRAFGAMTTAYKDSAALVKKMGIGEDLDYNKLPADVRDAVEQLVNRGRIDINIGQELGGWSSIGEGWTAQAKNVHRKLKQVVQKTELINRIATGMAAYRLAKQRGSSNEAAVDYAEKVIQTTHGDYSGANAPRFMRTNVGRLLTQFRKFQLIQISLMTRLFNDAFNGESAEVKAAARRALVWTMTHAAIAGGIMGLPGFAALAAAYSMLFGDDDDPEKPLSELAMRRYFGEYGDLMVKGLPAALGVDVSGKIGAGNMLSILPYTDLELSRSGWEKLVTAAMGPFVGGLAPRMLDGASQIMDGNFYKGLELVLPKGLGDAMKAARITTEGVTQRNNDVVLSADEVTFVDGFMQALGLPTTKLTERQFRAKTQVDFDKFFRERTTELKQDYAKAYRSNNAEGMKAARDDWQELQDARTRNGYARQPLSNLLKSPTEQRKRERDTAGGIQFTKSTRRFAETLPQ